MAQDRSPPTILGRGSWSETTPDRRHPPQGDRRRSPAAARHPRRDGVGELARPVTPTQALRRLRRSGRRRCTCTSPSRPGPPTGCWRSSSSWSGWSSSASSWPATCATRAGPRCRSWPRSAGWRRRRWSTCWSTSAPGATRCGAGRSRPPPTSRSRSPILAVISTHLPTALRTFLLTLAVVDDLLAITIIALFYTSDLDVLDAAAGPGAARALRRGGAATDPVLVAPAAAGRGDLDAGARLRGARHRGRRPARLHRAGAAQPRRRRTRGGPGAGRALRAPDPADLGRLRGPGVRVLRRRRRDRRLVRAGGLAQRPGGDRHRRGPGGRQDRRDLRHHVRAVQADPRRPRPRPAVARRARRLDAGRHRLHGLPADRRPGVRRGQRPRRPRQGRGAVRLRCWPRCWPAILLKARDRAYRRIELEESVDSDHDGIPDVYQHDRFPGSS